MDDTTTPATKEELLALIRAEWEALMDTAARLSDDQMLALDEGGWSPKDNLAHLAEWMKVLMGYHMDKRPAPEVLAMPEELTANWDMEEINPILWKRNHDRPAADVISELKAVYAQLMSRLESMPWEDLMAPRYEDDPEKQPLLIWVMGDTSDHFAEHRLTIEKSL